MIRNFIITALRNLSKHKLYSAINILGLALGVACCLIIFVVIRYETSFDSWHQKADRIYRVNLYQQTTGGGQVFNGCNYDPLAEAIRADVSGLEAVTGVHCLQIYQAAQAEKIVEGQYAFFVDEHYPDVFDVSWIAGNTKSALKNKNTVVVTEKFANDFLDGSRNALGKTFVLENRLNLTVTGVVKDPPSNTDHPYSLLISYPSLAEFSPPTVDNWNTVTSGATYLVFNTNTQRDKIEGQLNNVAAKYLPKEVASRTTFALLPLKDNHDRNFDYTSFTYDFPLPVMIILSIVAAMIAFIACINFVNLATAQSFKRAKEVGLRKTMGSSRWNLLVQFLSEAFVVTLAAVILAIILAHFAMDHLNELYGGHYLTFDFIGQPSILIFIVGVVIVIGALAGFYPAFVLSRFNPVAALKAQVIGGKNRGTSIRRLLVIVQFAAAQMLIAVTMITINQIAHFKDRPLSYNPETVLMVPYLRGNDNNEFEKFRDELHRIPGIKNYSFGNVGNSTARVGNDNQSGAETAIVSYIDTSYVHTFHVRFIAGKNFAHTSGANTWEVIVNEKLIRTLGLDNGSEAINHMFSMDERNVVIRGVVADSFTDPMSSNIDPLVFVYDPSRFTSVAITLSSENIPETLRSIDNAWREIYPDFLMKYRFMDEVLNKEYGFYNIHFNLLGTASLLAIFIGCLGLYGLISFMAIQRTKEIGIRKIFGAKVSDIMTMFTKESVILIAVSFVIASPLAHFIGKALLAEFPEKVNPGYSLFLLTFLISLLIGLFTVGYRSFIAARENPAQSLRSE